MRKILFSIFALLLMAGFVYADSDIQSGDNTIILGSHMGPTGKTPPTEVQKCYVTSHGTLAAGKYDASAAVDTGIDVGDVVEWDTTRADGYSVSIGNSDWATEAPTTCQFAGVMVTACSRDTATLTTPSGSGTNVGYMAIRGFCLAKVDTSLSVVGEPLIMNGATLAASFATIPTGDSTRKGHSMSQDIGTLLTDDGYDGLMKVVLR